MNMQRHKFFYSLAIICGVLLLFVLAVGSAVAGGQGVASKFEAVDVACGIFDGDGDLNFAGIVLSDDPRMAGTSKIEIAFVGQKVLVDATFFLTEVAGTWVAPGQSTATPARVIHKGYGTGDLAGQEIVLTAQIIDEFDNPPCEPVGPIVRLAGTIIEPPRH